MDVTLEFKGLDTWNILHCLTSSWSHVFQKTHNCMTIVSSKANECFFLEMCHASDADTCHPILFSVFLHETRQPLCSTCEVIKYRPWQRQHVVNLIEDQILVAHWILSIKAETKPRPSLW
jgi:hypothetical protein